MNVKIDQESLNALREQLRQVSDTCSRMEHCLVRVDITKPMVLDYLDRAKRLTDQAIGAFNDTMEFLAMTPEEFSAWSVRYFSSGGDPYARKS